MGEADALYGIAGLVSIYTDPEHVVLYAGNADTWQEFSTVLAVGAVADKLTPSGEATEVRRVVCNWVEAPSLDHHFNDIDGASHISRRDGTDFTHLWAYFGEIAHFSRILAR
ncbi:hypothetical protein ACWDTT_11705 [Streptosporangium sandarakinum]